MDTALTTTNGAAFQAPVTADTVTRILRYARAASAAATRRAHVGDSLRFARWAAGQVGDELPDLPRLPRGASEDQRTARESEAARIVAAYLPASPLTVAAWVDALTAEGKAPSTVRRYVSSLAAVHRAMGHESPVSDVVRRVLKGAKRTQTDAGWTAKEAAPLLAVDARRIVRALDRTKPAGMRDAAVVLVGLATGMRRSELSALELRDLHREGRGYVLTIRRSKTDQDGTGREVSVTPGRNSETCPVAALDDWLCVAGGQGDALPVFCQVGRWGDVRRARAMSGQSVGAVLTRSAVAAGYRADAFTAHSLRAGHVTARAVAGDSDSAIMDSTGHRSTTMLRRYDRAAKRFRHDASGSVGL